MVVNRNELAGILGVDVRSIKNFVDDGMPKLTRGKYDVGACVKWYVEHEREKARAGKGLNDLDLARQRKTIAEAREAELRVEERLANVVPVEMLAEVGGRLADRLLPVLQNIPANYSLRLEECGVPAQKAEAVLESVALELTTALRDTVEADDDEEFADAESHDGASAVA